MTEIIPSCNGAGLTNKETSFADFNEICDMEYDKEMLEDYWESHSEIKSIGGIKMVTLKEQAIAYEPPQTLNVADLDEVPVELELMDREGKDQTGETFKYKVVELNGKEYRVPNPVLEEIQTILKLKPSVTKVKVNKTGTGVATRYKVEALD